MHTFTGGLLAVTTALVLAAPAALASSVTPFTDFAPPGTFEGDTVGFRLKGPQTGNIDNVYIGKNDLGVASNRVDYSRNWNNGVSIPDDRDFEIHPFTFLFDTTNGSASLTFEGSDALTYEFDGDPFVPDTVAIRQFSGDQDARLQSFISFPDSTQTYEPNGNSAGRGGLILTDFGDEGALDDDGIFTLAGTLWVTPTLTNSEATVFEATIGRGAASVIPLPAAGWLLLSGLAGLGVIARRKRAAA